jgi:endoglucanase
MKSTFFALAAMTAAGSASASVAGYGQCGGSNWSGESSCASGFSCQKQNDWYSQCVPGSAAATKPAATKAASTKAASTKAASTKAAFKPTSAKSSSAPAKTTSTKAAAVKPAATSQKSSAAKPAATTVSHASSGGVQYAGVNVCENSASEF